MQTDLLLAYLDLGWYLLPVDIENKSPTCTGGHKSASNDPAQILRWAKTAQAFAACGYKSKLVILDQDDRHGGHESILQFVLPPTLTAQSGGGMHYYFRAPLGWTDYKRVLAPGIDIVYHRIGYAVI